MNSEHAGFESTRWSLVARAAVPGSPGAREAMGELCRAYWWPMYAYLRRRGLDAGAAADTVQELFAEFLEKGRLAQVDPSCGRFRTWLLAALKFRVSHAREHARAAKRGGNAVVAGFDPAEADERWQIAGRRDLQPEHIFERAWALEVLARALRELEARYASKRKAELFAALKPCLIGDAGLDRPRAAAIALGMTEGAVRVAVHRIRSAYREAIRAEVAATLADPDQVDDEVRSLFAALSS